MTTIEERLAEQLDAKDAELAKAREESENLERRIASMEGGWTLPVSDAEDEPGLPLPRLEYRWFKLYAGQAEDDWSSYRVIYQLVVRHLCDGIVEIPLGHTTVNGHRRDGLGPWQVHPATPADRRLRCDLPFRDGSHGHHDAAHLGLPLYAVPPVGDPIRLSNDPNYDHQTSLGIQHRRGEKRSDAR